MSDVGLRGPDGNPLRLNRVIGKSGFIVEAVECPFALETS